MFSCEKNDYTDMRGRWEANNTADYKITMLLFHSGTVITGSGTVIHKADPNNYEYDISIEGNYFYPGVTLTFYSSETKESTFDGMLIDKRTLQGKLNGYTNLVFKRL